MAKAAHNATPETLPDQDTVDELYQKIGLTSAAQRAKFTSFQTPPAPRFQMTVVTTDNSQPFG